MAPDKFKGEPAYTEYYWTRALAGKADIDEGDGTFSFIIDSTDLERWPDTFQLGWRLRLWTDESGSVYSRLYRRVAE